MQADTDVERLFRPADLEEKWTFDMFMYNDNVVITLSGYLFICSRQDKMQ